MFSFHMMVKSEKVFLDNFVQKCFFRLVPFIGEGGTGKMGID